MAGPSAEDKHLADTIKPREGFYRKEGDGQELDYKKTWSGNGFGKMLYQIHHIVPEDAIYNKAVELVKNDDKRKLVKTCMLKSKWNINDADNLIGLPDLYSFLIYFDRKKGNDDDEKVGNKGEGTYIRNKISRLNQRSKKKDDFIDLKSLFGELGSAGANPETYPVHLPVSWGHTKYNYAVADDIKKKVINPINKKGEEHKVVLKNVAQGFKDTTSKWKDYLKTRAATATYDTWKLRYKKPKVSEDTWRTPFTMHTKSSSIS
ncbi:MAG: hypothetical protein Rubg2KO_37730 [Rubricoccaceae bacterium]